MDPLACYEMMLDALYEGSVSLANEQAQYILEWEQKGGFIPTDIDMAIVRFWAGN